MIAYGASHEQNLEASAMDAYCRAKYPSPLTKALAFTVSADKKLEAIDKWLKMSDSDRLMFHDDIKEYMESFM